MRNNSTNNGSSTDSVFETDPAIIGGFDGCAIPDEIQGALMAGDGNVDALDRDFKIPSTYKVATGIDYTFDIPGSDLQAVVIEKLPFEVPTELRKRREARIRETGGDPFERFALGKMLLHLKQMAGRLIRTEEDRGLVVIVDARPDKRYFERLVEALPPGTEVLRARIDELPGMLAEVGAGPGAPANR